MKNQIEIERKYVIKMPSISFLRQEEGYTESRIVQIYLDSEKGITHRIRSRKYADFTEYTETKKTRVDSMSAVEEEREISEEEFLCLSKKIKSGTLPVIKTRYTFLYKGVTVEIDVYPAWERSAILETELETRDYAAEFPPFIEIIREVTGDKRYSNAAMSESFPEEII
jgi:CYTH domain-containing protein